MKRNATILLAVVLAAAGPALAAPFAMVTDLKGEAWTVEGAPSQKLALLAYIEKPTEIKLDPQARLAVTYFADGVQYSFTGPARLRLTSSETPSVLEGPGAQSRKVTPEKSIGGGLSPEQWRRLQQATVVMRVVRPTFAVLGPDKTAILDREPEFEWAAVSGAKAYRLVVYGGDNQIVHEATSDQTALRPGSSLSLEPGKSYRWKVDALGVSKPVSASGTFSVASDAVREQLASLKQAAGADPAARVFYATTLEAQGLAHDARAEWRSLARDFPDEPEYRRRARQGP